MKEKPRLDFLYLLILVCIIYLLLQYNNLTTESLISHLVFFDIIIGFLLIIMGLVKWKMSYIITGSFCALCAFYSSKNISDFTLFFLIVGGLVGVGNHIKETMGKIID